MTIAVAVLALAGCEGAGYHSARGARLSRFTLHSRLTHRVFKLRPPRRLWIDLGASEPFRSATLTYARRAGVRAHVWPGGHDVAFWHAHTPAYLRFFARACA